MKDQQTAIGYDIIGDVHGNWILLKHTLKSLGYEKVQGVYQHPTRKVIYVGDILNKGTQVAKTYKHVRRMVDGGHAQMVLGNHEYMYMTYFTKDGSGKYLIPHNAKNQSRLRQTLREFPQKEQREELLKWLRERPLFLEINGFFRVVHACWQQQSIDYIQARSESALLTKSILRGSVMPESKAHRHIHTLLVGPKLVRNNRNNYHLQKSYNTSSSIKMKWWLDGDKTISKLSFNKSKLKKGKRKPPTNYRNTIQPYPSDAIPLFIGHYRLQGERRLLKKNLCCLDFGAIAQNRLGVYSYDGEASLSKHKLRIFSLT